MREADSENTTKKANDINVSDTLFLLTWSEYDNNLIAYCFLYFSFLTTFLVQLLLCYCWCVSVSASV